MYCDKCGAQLTDPQQFCHSCGKSFASADTAPATPFRGRVDRHASIVGVLWIVYSLLHLTTAVGAVAIGAIGWPFLHSSHPPQFMIPMLATAAGLMGIVSIVGAIAGFAVINYQRWSRICLLVLGFLALLNIPLGTALGIYTIWVLLPAESDAEFSRLAHSR